MKLPSRHFALCPAAGSSSRMGRTKLLLPLAGRPLVEYVIEAWKQGGVGAVVAVVRGGDAELAAAIEAAGGEVVVADPPPPDMKASIQAGLRHVEARYAPPEQDAFLVAPADMPKLSPAIVRRLIDEHRREPGRILVPTLAGRRGHPVLFPWPFASLVHQLPADEGLNALVDRHPATPVACDDLVTENEQPFGDLDTPEQYQRLADEYEDGEY